MGVILEQLKSATAAAHASLEQRLRIVHAAPALADYRAYLTAMHGFTLPLEAGWANLPQGLRDAIELDKRSKAHLLRRDLDALDARLGPVARPLCRLLPPRDTDSDVLGALYVLEGSTLGARYLLRHLAPLGIADASRYLNSYGEELGAMWHKLRAVLAAHEGRQSHTLVQSALRTFELLDVWLVDCGAARASEAA